MAIDVQAALDAPPRRYPLRWSEADVLLYHLALGAGATPTDPGELRYCYEKDLQVLPTFAVVAAGRRSAPGGAASGAAAADPAGGTDLGLPGIDVDLAAVLHAGQSIVVATAIPAAADLRAQTRVAAVYDKGGAAVVELETEARTAADGAGTPVFTSRSQIFVRGAGGFGGQRGPSSAIELPARPPELVTEVPTLPQQALLYRLCGDANPLHVDPDFAKLAGFDRPILHGLCTYGMVARALIERCLGGDAARLGGYRARFVGVLYPGETIRLRVWREGAALVALAGAAERDDAPVLRARLLPRPA